VNRDLVPALLPVPGCPCETGDTAVPAESCRAFEALLQDPGDSSDEASEGQEEDLPRAGELRPLGDRAGPEANETALTWSLVDQTVSCLKTSDTAHSGSAVACLRLKGQVLGGSEIQLEREGGRLQVKIRPASARAAGVMRGGLAALQSALEEAAVGCTVCIDLRVVST
jgi:hypothetical protein